MALDQLSQLLDEDKRKIVIQIANNIIHAEKNSQVAGITIGSQMPEPKNDAGSTGPAEGTPKLEVDAKNNAKMEDIKINKGEAILKLDSSAMKNIELGGAAPKPPPEPAKGWLERHQTLVGSIIAGVVAIVVAIIAWTAATRPPALPTPPVSAPAMPPK